MTPLIAREPVEYLRTFLAERTEGVLGLHDVAYILKVTAREILPAAGLARRCPQLELFADWTVHGEIDRSASGTAAIAKVAEAIPLHGQEGHDDRWLEEHVNGAVSFAALRLELVAVCRRFGLPEALFTSWESWQRFALPLSYEVSGRPIRLGQRGPAAKAAAERVSKTSLDPAFSPQSLMLGVDASSGKRWWVITTAGATRIVIQVLFGGIRESDFPVPEGWISVLAEQ